MLLRKMCLSLAALSLFYSGIACAETHALIMTISQYKAGIPPLKGVVHDVNSAKNMALQMGVQERNLQHLKDEQLTVAGMRKAFDELESKLNLGDEVFIYYSGHGGRTYVEDVVDGRCAESLVSVDGQAFLDSEVEDRLKKLSEKAQKVIVFLDACHSGGAVTRAFSEEDPPYTPKYWSKSKADACAKPVNVLTRNLDVAAKSAGSGAQNFVYISAAKENEISFDQPNKGGVATQSWLKCLSGDAADLDKSGALTVEEIRTCAQNKIDESMRLSNDFKPHHLSIVGNADMVMKLGSVTATPSNSTASVSEPAKPVEISASAFMRDIYNRRDDKRTVAFLPTKTTLKIGSDPLDFSLTSSHAGYVYVLMSGSDGTSFDMLFPNKIDSNNMIRAGESLRLPRDNWAIVAQGPEGKDHLLVIVADSPRDFSGVGMTASGPFSSIKVSTNAAVDIQQLTRVSSNASLPECRSDGPKRTLAVVERKCSNAYGAALLTIEEVK